MEERIRIDKFHLGDIVCNCFGNTLLVVEVEKYITKVIGWGIHINDFSYYISNILYENYRKIGNIFEEKKSEN